MNNIKCAMNKNVYKIYIHFIVNLETPYYAHSVSLVAGQITLSQCVLTEQRIYSTLVLLYMCVLLKYIYIESNKQFQ